MPNQWGGSIITAAAVQTHARIPNVRIQEGVYESRDFFDEIVRGRFEWQDGELIPPDRPGIGIECDEWKLEAHSGRLADFARR